MFRASLRALLATDPVVRRQHRAARRHQLQIMRGRPRAGGPRDALNLLITERIADALADGEAAAIGLSRRVIRDYLIGELRAVLGRRRRRRS